MTTTTTTMGLSLMVSLGMALAGGCATDVAAPLEETCTGEGCDLVTQEDQEAMLDALGVDLDPDAPTDPNGEPLPERHNPLGSTNTTLFSVDELFFVGTAVAGESRVGLLDDEQAGGELLLSAADDAWAADPTKAVAIDLDGDGIEEIAVVALTENEATGETVLRARTVRRDSDGSFAMSDPTTVATFVSSPIDTSRFWTGYFQIDATAADLDGDGSDDLFVSVGPHLLQLRHDGSALELVDERTFGDRGGDANAELYVRLAAGDLELDGRDELVIVHSAYYSAVASYAYYEIVAGDLSGVLREGDVQRTSGGVRALRTASPAIADLDGDGVSEIVLAGRSADEAGGLLVLVMNGSKHVAPYTFAPIHWEDSTQRTALYPLAAADLFGSRRKQVLAGSTILRLDASGELAVVRELPVVPNTDVTAVGDYTGDHREDILFMRGSGSGIDPSAYGLSPSIVHVDSSDTLQIADLGGSVRMADYPTFALANVDDDSMVVRFLERELVFSDPSVIAAVAAPPTFAGSGQADGSTVFGRSTADETESEESLSYSVEVGIGFEYEDPTGLYGVQGEFAFEWAWGWTTSHVRSIERTVSFATGPEEDKVVFTAVPYDVYIYEVVSSPHAEAVGTHVSVGVPREPQVLSVSRDFYNERVRGQVASIDESVLSHEIGSPFSYPTGADREGRVAAGDALISDLVTVGVGTGSTSVTVSLSEGIGEGTIRERNQTLEVGGKYNGITGRVTGGRSFSVTETVTNTAGTFYEGTVGDIPRDRIDDVGLYQFGLLAYPQSHGGREILVVTYWVEE